MPKNIWPHTEAYHKKQSETGDTPQEMFRDYMPQVAGRDCRHAKEDMAIDGGKPKKTVGDCRHGTDKITIFISHAKESETTNMPQVAARDSRHAKEDTVTH